MEKHMLKRMNQSNLTCGAARSLQATWKRSLNAQYCWPANALINRVISPIHGEYGDLVCWRVGDNTIPMATQYAP